MSVPHKRCRLRLPSAEAIAAHEDLLTQILIRLPQKSLGQFKCVSKRWNSLISHPHFSLLRRPHSVSGYFVRYRALPPPDSGAYSSRRKLYKFVHPAGKQPMSSTLKPFTSVGKGDAVTILYSCNGLLLLRFINIDNPDKLKYFVCNPTTKQFAAIPLPFHHRYQRVCSWVLAFEHFRAPHYKIVFLVKCSSSSTYQSEIYSTETGTWRFSGDPFTATLMDKAVFFNNTIHWCSESFESLLLFDVDQESFRTIPMPTISDVGDGGTIKYFGESRGHLNLIYGDNNTLNVLEMESDYSKLLLKIRIHLHDIAAITKSQGFAGIRIVHLLLPEVENESALVFYITGRIVSYNFKDKTLKKLGYLQRYERWNEAYPYIETLVRI